MTEEHRTSDPSDTPKTDAVVESFFNLRNDRFGSYVPASFARAQERKLAELITALTDLRHGIEENATDTVWCGPGETASERIYSMIERAKQP